MSVRTARCAIVIVVGLSVSATAQAMLRPPRAARSVHLGYAAPEAAVFYNELTVEKSVPGSYFMACGFRHGYFGIQELGNGKKVVIFSVWDPARGDNPNAVATEDRVEVLYKADDVIARRFGGEGTGGQSFYNYDWKIGQVCRFLVKATVSEGKTTYAAFCLGGRRSSGWSKTPQEASSNGRRGRACWNRRQSSRLGGVLVGLNRDVCGPVKRGD